MRIILCNLAGDRITELLSNNYIPSVNSTIISEGVAYTVNQLSFNDDEDTLYIYVRDSMSFKKLLDLIHKQFNYTKELNLAQLLIMANMIKKNQLLYSVKYCKEVLNIGLKEAKDVVDFIKNDYGDLLQNN